MTTKFIAGAPEQNSPLESKVVRDSLNALNDRTKALIVFPVIENSLATRSVKVEGGTVYFPGNQVVNVATRVINFLDSEHSLPNVSGYRFAHLSVSLDGNINITYSNNSSSVNGLFVTTPTNQIPIANILLKSNQDGSIQVIRASDIIDVRPTVSLSIGGDAVTMSARASESIAAGDVVAVIGSTAADNEPRVVKANADTAFPAIGIALVSATSGNPISVVQIGSVTFAAETSSDIINKLNHSLGQMLYLSRTPGRLTTSPSKVSSNPLQASVPAQKAALQEFGYIANRLVDSGSTTVTLVVQPGLLVHRENTINKSLVIGEELVSRGNVTLNSVDGGTTTIKGATTLESTLNVLNAATVATLDVNGNSTIGGNSTVTGNETISGKFTAKDDVLIEKDLVVDNDIKGNSNLDIVNNFEAKYLGVFSQPQTSGVFRHYIILCRSIKGGSVVAHGEGNRVSGRIFGRRASGNTGSIDAQILVSQTNSAASPQVTSGNLVYSSIQGLTARLVHCIYEGLYYVALEVEHGQHTGLTNGVWFHGQCDSEIEETKLKIVFQDQISSVFAVANDSHISNFYAEGLIVSEDMFEETTSDFSSTSISPGTTTQVTLFAPSEPVGSRWKLISTGGAAISSLPSGVLLGWVRDAGSSLSISVMRVGNNTGSVAAKGMWVRVG